MSPASLVKRLPLFCNESSPEALLAVSGSCNIKQVFLFVLVVSCLVCVVNRWIHLQAHRGAPCRALYKHLAVFLLLSSCCGTLFWLPWWSVQEA